MNEWRFVTISYMHRTWFMIMIIIIINVENLSIYLSKCSCLLYEMNEWMNEFEVIMNKNGNVQKYKKRNFFFVLLFFIYHLYSINIKRLSIDTKFIHFINNHCQMFVCVCVRLICKIIQCDDDDDIRHVKFFFYSLNLFTKFSIIITIQLSVCHLSEIFFFGY